MIAKDEYEKMSDRDRRHEQMREIELRRRNMQSIITTALLERGISVKVKSRNVPAKANMAKKINTFGIRLSPDVEMELESEWHTSNDIEMEWGYKMNMYIFPRLNSADEEHRFTMDIERIMERASSVFLIDSWDEESFVDIWTAFVFCDKGLFEKFVENLKDAPIISNMSAILVDTRNMVMLKEEWISSADKVSSPFEEPIYNSSEWFNKYAEFFEDDEDDEE